MEVGGEMVQVELFWELALAKAANHRTIFDLMSTSLVKMLKDKLHAILPKNQQAFMHAI
jgi:hypothetical protein